MPTMVDLVCSNCKKPFQRRIADVNNCKRRGFVEVACSRQCGLAIRNKTFFSTAAGRTVYERMSAIGRKFQAERSLLPEQILARFISRVASRAKLVNSRKFGLESWTNRDYLWTLWQNQNGICALSGLPMEIPFLLREAKENKGRKARHLSPWRASLDRVDSSMGYIPGNVQFVCTLANIAKADFTQSDLIDFCRSVASKHPLPPFHQ